jgi:hypothetical protein
MITGHETCSITGTVASRDRIEDQFQIGIPKKPTFIGLRVLIALKANPNFRELRRVGPAGQPHQFSLMTPIVFFDLTSC